MNPKLKRILKGSALALAALLITAFLAGTWISCASSAEIDRELARIAAAREPVKLAEITPPPIADSDNAAPLLMAALKPLEKEEETATLVDDQGRLKIDSADRARAIVTARVDVLKKLREALAKPACRFAVPYEDGYDAVVPHVILLVQAGRLLAAESDLHRRTGDFSAAAESAFDVVRLADTMRTEPTLVSLMVRVALFNLALDRFEGLPLTPEQETRLLAAFDPAAIRNSFRTTMQAERALGIHAYVGLIAGDSGTTKDFDLPWFYTSWFAGPYLRRDFVRYLDLMRPAIDQASHSYSEAERAFKVMQVQAHGRTLGMVSLAGLIAPLYTGRFQRCVEIEARMQEARLSIEVRRTGALPAKAPADPFSGKPYSFKKTADGFTLWSVGADGVDDGGDPKKDVVWTHKN